MTAQRSELRPLQKSCGRLARDRWGDHTAAPQARCSRRLLGESSGIWPQGAALLPRLTRVRQVAEERAHDAFEERAHDAFEEHAHDAFEERAHDAFEEHASCGRTLAQITESARACGLGLGGSAGRTISVFSCSHTASPGFDPRGFRTYFLRV